MTTVTKENIQNEIESVVREAIHSGEVVNVSVKRGFDADGDDIIIVNVIFDNKKKTLDASETSHLTRRVRSRLITLNETGFPFFSYIAKSEAGKLAAA